MSDTSFRTPIDALLRDYCDVPALAFAPVPGRARSDGWTPERQRGFVHRLALCGSVAAAARGVGMTRRSAYRLRDRAGAEGFAAAWDEALGWGKRSTGDLAIERALNGEVVPIFYRGRQVGERVRYDNSLLLAVLKLGERRRAAGTLLADPEATLSSYLYGGAEDRSCRN